MSRKMPATVVACAAVVAVVGPGFCRGATCLLTVVACAAVVAVVGPGFYRGATCRVRSCPRYHSSQSAKYFTMTGNKGEDSREVLVFALA